MKLVIACPRSGTKFMAAVYMLGHEKPNEKGMSSWYAAADDPEQPAGTHVPISSFSEIIHLVRNPLHVLRSLRTISEKSWAFAHLTVACGEVWTLVNAARFWVYWNRLCEFQRPDRLRVEDLGDSDINARPKQGDPITWTQLALELPQNLYVDMVRMAEEYGYQVT